MIEKPIKKNKKKERKKKRVHYIGHACESETKGFDHVSAFRFSLTIQYYRDCVRPLWTPNDKFLG